MVSFGVSIPSKVAPTAREDREAAAKLVLPDEFEAGFDDTRRATEGGQAGLVSAAGHLRQRARAQDRPPSPGPSYYRADPPALRSSAANASSMAWWRGSRCAR